MKALIALLGFAALCSAQTSPSIVSKLTLNDQTKLLGSLQSPVPLYTPAEDGFYRMTIYTWSENSQILACRLIPQNPQLVWYNQCAETYGDTSYTMAFPVKAGQPISYFTAAAAGTTFSGSYNLSVVIEHLY